MDIKPTTHLQDITDLTVMAPVRRGLVPGAFNAYSYVYRLATVLRVLHAVRQASRESALQRSPFTDSIGRFRSIHFFRFAVVPPAAPAADSNPHQLLLNVTFDGGWEPYMRLVWGPLGKLLDLIFCNCEGYPLSSRHSFEEYVRWVRGHEVPSSFFYADSAATVADMHYLRALEELHYAGRGREDPDAGAVGLAMQDPPATAVPSLYAVTQAIRVIKALAGLRDYFPSDDFVAGKPQQQDLILLRFTRDLLADLRSWIEQGMFDPGGPFDSLNAGFRHERAWLMQADPKEPLKEDRSDFKRSNVQAGIVESYPDAVRHGVLVLARIEDVQAAKKNWLARSATPDTGETPAMYRSVALTYSGLRQLDVPANWLGRFPYEFRAGMEERAGLLGDLRGNHPDNWKRPTPNWPNEAARGAPIDLSSVHVVIQLRAALDDVEEENSAEGTILVKRFTDAIKELDRDCGLKVLHVQPMRLNPRREGESAGRDHFGFVDGISQPRIPAVPTPPTSFWTDRVKTGDVFLGYANTRGDKPHHFDPEEEPLLLDGTFLVVRKIAQFPERFDAVVSRAAMEVDPDAGDNEHERLCEDIKGRLMGRYSNGDPMIRPAGPGRNDFIFRDDAAGGQCPHRSHIRRANPRTPLPGQPAPRIVRRGMSYVTPAQDAAAEESRGIVFMAYNSSIAEQFEVIQRWLAGGNSSGLSSTHDDPFVGVPEIGRARTYRYVRDGKVMHVDLGEAPLTELQWGVYAFVPSMRALEKLATDLDDVPGEGPHGEPQPVGLEKWRALLEDDNVRARTWARARATEKETGEPMSAEEYGLLVSTPKNVLRVLQDDGRELSVCGYGQRMTDSGIGLGYLGLDDAGEHHGHEVQAPEVNAAIEEITEEKAFAGAFQAGSAVIARTLAGYAAATGTAKGPLDVVEYGRAVLSSLCTSWFGLPDGRLMHHGTKADDQAGDDKTRCPGHFLTVSRYVFGPHPTPAVEKPAMLHGRRVLAAVQAMLAEAGPGQEKLTPLVKAIVNAKGIDGDKDLAARTVAGVMLGFPPTVLGNLVTVLIKWIATRELWALQVDLPEDESDAPAALRDRFLGAMRENPVPYAVWRTAKTKEKVIVGLGSAMADKGDSMLMFGGSRKKDSASHAPHACPGYGMAMGVMLGSVAALLKGAALAPTPDPRTLILTGLKPPPPPEAGNADAADPGRSRGATPFALS